MWVYMEKICEQRGKGGEYLKNLFMMGTIIISIFFSTGCTEATSEEVEPKDVQEKKMTQDPMEYVNDENKVKGQSKHEEPMTEQGQSIQAGEYEVGKDIPPGEYLVISSGMTYVEARNDEQEGVDHIIFNDNLLNDANTYVTLESGEYFQFEPGKMYAVDEDTTNKPDDGYYEDGMYKVGTDIPPGEYEVDLAEDSFLDMGYIEISEDSRHNLSNIVSNDVIESSITITLKEGQYVKLQDVYIDVDA